MLLGLIVTVISRSVLNPNQRVVALEYIQIVFVRYTSIKLEYILKVKIKKLEIKAMTYLKFFETRKTLECLLTHANNMDYFVETSVSCSILKRRKNKD